MDEFLNLGGAGSLPEAPAARHNPLVRWLRANRVPLLFALLMLLVLPMRDLWSPDEPDFAQCVREMRERGSWLLPYLNGQPYSEKPILFYWLMKVSAMGLQRLTGGAGFVHGIAAWALRLPSVLAAIGFMFGFRAWAARFLRRGLADPAAMILAAVPIWLWQAQAIQIDMLFAALLAWSWLAWLGGYLLLREHAARRRPGEERRFFLGAYVALALAFLAKGPLALALSLPLCLAFLAWQRDLRALGSARLGRGLLAGAVLVLPWYLAAGLRGGGAYAYQMVVHQNLERALHAWDHIQPPWKYVEYLASDFFPWCLLLPSLALFLGRSRAWRSPAARFLILAVAVPFLMLSCSQSKQGKYLLMAYPFLALLVAALLRSAAEAGGSRVRRLGGLLAAGLGLPGLALAAVAWCGAGGGRLQGQLLPYLGPLRLMAVLFLLGAAALAARAASGAGRGLARDTALTLGLVFLVLGTWGFRRLDPLKGYRNWTAAVQPLIAGRQVYFWQTIRSGAMVYTDHLMPELRSRAELEQRLGPEQRLVAMDREWDANAWGMDPQARKGYQVLLRMPVGGGEALLLRRLPAPAPSPKEP
jgi:4-amino-4-deoxy-L-arabinose transferase-like glycosyltransferase